jgi:hypothetical protein
MKTDLEIIDADHYCNEQQVVRFHLQTKENRFFQKHESVPKFHRSLSNGWHQTNSITNRAWWSTNVQLGIYQYQILDGDLSIVYSILFKSNNIDLQWNQLRYRIHNSYYFSFIKRLDNISVSELTHHWNSRLVSKPFGFKSSNFLISSCELPPPIHQLVPNSI